ncbi:hypothetical protein Tco_1523093 [Tanacetum coccineum]
MLSTDLEQPLEVGAISQTSALNGSTYIFLDPTNIDCPSVRLSYPAPLVDSWRNILISSTGVLIEVQELLRIARHGLVRGLPKLKFEKDHLCFACAMGKSKKKPHKPKFEDTNQEKLYLLHMDLCGPMRVWYETDIQEKDKKKAKRPNQARDGKDKVKSKPKTVKVRKSTQTKSKVNQVKKIQLEGLKLPNPKLYHKNNKTRTKIGNWEK